MDETPTHDEHRGSAGAGAPTQEPLARLRAELLDAAEEVSLESGGRGAGAVGVSLEAITLERPRRREFGDLSTNAPLLLGRALGIQPRELAERLGAALRARLGDSLERFDVAGPGFLNLFLSDGWRIDALAAVLAAGDRFGAGGAEPPQRVLVEFVSANPTGPMHVGHARNAAYGDSLARILSFYGHRVAREFYVNDAGSQVRKFGESIRAAALGEEPPADGYRGDYVGELAASIEGAAGKDAAALGDEGVALMVGEMDRELRAFGVKPFDRWSYESALHRGDPSPVARTLELLEERGHTYRHEGALWLRTTAFGDDKDRPLVRSNGEPTYFASDIAYHQDKRERGFEHQLDVWGADHHGYVARIKAAYAALGGDPAELELLIMQLVHLLRGGERAQMSKRSGEFVSLEELIAEIGVDASRWYLLARSHDTTVDLDLDLAREQSSENPVYYVQYAHARIASILARAGAERVERALAEAAGAPRPLHESERALIEQLLAWPGELREAAARRAPHRVAAYALELAQGFTGFYRDCRVLGAEPEAVESLRIALSVAARTAIAACLTLLGVSAPDRM